MPDDLRINVSGNTDRYTRAIDKARQGTEDYRDSLQRLELELVKVENQLQAEHVAALEKSRKAMEEHRDAAARMGEGMVMAGAAIAAGLGLAAREAIAWESAWAGVTKVTTGSPAQMAELEGELRQLARTLPATHAEIAGVAEAAGQLGVKRQDVAKFTKVMIDMATSTNMTADEAATSMARFANIMGIPMNQVDRLGAAVVALGNDGASTESEIMEMGLRIAGAGRVAGLSSPQVLALANALSSVGIEAESGGSSMSTLLIKISEAVTSGGEKLERFAEVAGMSAQAFAAQWRENPTKALVAFEKGLEGVKQSGGDVFGTLNSLEITEIRQRDAVLRLAGAHDLLAASLLTGQKGWEDNTALINEANKRYLTTESRVKIARNQLADLAITVGDTLLPVLGSLATTVGGVLDAFNDLPGPVKAAVTILAAVAGTILLVGGGALMAAPRIAAMNATLATLGGVSGAAATGLRAVSSVMFGPWGLAITAAVVGVGMLVDSQRKAREQVQQLKDTLDEQTGALTDNTRAFVAKSLSDEGVLEVAEDLGLSMKDVTDAALGQDDAIKRVNGQLDAMKGKYAEGGRSAMDSAAGLRKVRDAINGNNESLAEAVAQQRREAAAVGESTQAHQEAAPVAETVADSIASIGKESGLTESEVKDLEKAIEDVKNSLRLLNGEVLNSEEANIAFRDQMRAMTKEVKENGASMAANTATGDRNRQMLIDGIEAAKRSAEAVFDKTDKEKGHSAAVRASNSVMAANIKKLYDTAVASGISKDAAADYIAKILGIPKTSVTKYTAPGLATALEKSGALESTANRLDGMDVRTTFTTQYIRNYKTTGDPDVSYGHGMPGRGSATPNWGGARARGGPVGSGSLYLVGEDGPELAMFDRPGDIIPANTTSQLLRGFAAGMGGINLEAAKNGGRLNRQAIVGGGSDGAAISVANLNVYRAPDEPTERSVDMALQRTAFLLGM